MNEGSNNTTYELNTKTTRHQTKNYQIKLIHNETTKLTNTSCEPQFNSGGPAAEAAAFKYIYIERERERKRNK